MKKIHLIGIGLALSLSAASQNTDNLAQSQLGEKAYSLDELTDYALRENIAVRNAQDDIKMAQEQRKEAFTNYFPNVSAIGMWFNANKGMSAIDIDPSSMLTPELGAVLAQTFPPEALAALANPVSISMMKNGTIASVTATQPLFAGGQIVNGNKLAKVGEEVSLLKRDLSAREVEKNVAQYFWQLAALKEKVNTLDAVDKLLEGIHKDVDLAVKAGLAMRNDLLQVQLRQNEMKSQRLKLNNGISIIRMLMAQYCGLRDTAFTVVYDTQTDVPLENRKEHQQAVTCMPEYQLLEKQVEAADLQKKMTLGQNLPTMVVGAGYNFHNLMGNDRTFAMVFATVSVPISGWWGGSHAIKRKKIELQKAQDQLADNTQLLGIQLEKSWNDVEEAYQQILLARKSIEQAEENLRLNQDFYKAGTTKMSDLLEAQLLCQQAHDKFVDAWAEYQNKLLDYNLLVGNSQRNKALLLSEDDRDDGHDVGDGDFAVFIDVSGEMVKHIRLHVVSVHDDADRGHDVRHIDAPVSVHVSGKRFHLS